MNHKPLGYSEPVGGNSTFEDLLQAPRHRPDLDDGDGYGGGTEYVFRIVYVDDDDTEVEDDDFDDEPEPEPQKSRWWAAALGALLGFSIG